MSCPCFVAFTLSCAGGTGVGVRHVVTVGPAIVRIEPFAHECASVLASVGVVASVCLAERLEFLFQSGDVCEGLIELDIVGL